MEELWDAHIKHIFQQGQINIGLRGHLLIIISNLV